MKYINERTRMTDSLERELIARAIEEQMQFRPGKALKAFFSELFAKMNRGEQSAARESAQTAS